MYDLKDDPHEMKNIIHDVEYNEIRNQLYDYRLDEMNRISDPFRSSRWGIYEWRPARKIYYLALKNRPKPNGFPFQPTSPSPFYDKN